MTTFPKIDSVRYGSHPYLKAEVITGNPGRLIRNSPTEEAAIGSEDIEGPKLA
jgi:hypothetical protein